MPAPEPAISVAAPPVAQPLKSIQNLMAQLKEMTNKVAVLHQQALNEERGRLEKRSLEKSSLAASSEKASWTSNSNEKKGPNYPDLRFNTQNNLILTPKMRFDRWYDHLITDLKLKRINYLIDPTVPGPSGLTSDDRDQDKILFRKIIITSIDLGYHHRIIGVEDPVEILSRFTTHA